ncbi:MAG: ferredoxin [Candidatus Nanopelagicales bacterium]
MAKVTLDRTICVGSGACQLIAPRVFDDLDGFGVVLNDLIGSGERALVQEAIDCCPVQAIAWTADG